MFFFARINKKTSQVTLFPKFRQFQPQDSYKQKFLDLKKRSKRIGPWLATLYDNHSLLYDYLRGQHEPNLGPMVGYPKCQDGAILPTQACHCILCSLQHPPYLKLRSLPARDGFVLRMGLDTQNIQKKGLGQKPTIKARSSDVIEILID